MMRCIVMDECTLLLGMKVLLEWWEWCDVAVDWIAIGKFKISISYISVIISRVLTYSLKL